METYSTPKQGTYYFEVNKWDGTFEKNQVPVKIIGETEKSYKIQLLGFTYNRVPNDTLWATKRKVKVKGEENKQPANSGERYWWQDL